MNKTVGKIDRLTKKEISPISTMNISIILENIPSVNIVDI